MTKMFYKEYGTEDEEIIHQITEDAFSKYYETKQQYIDRMNANGFFVKLPNTDELFIDIDSDEMYELFKDRLQQLRFCLRVRNENALIKSTESPSKSGLPRRHIVLTSPLFGTLSIETKLVFQIFLGSDPVKEILSAFRFLDGDSDPCIFIEKKTRGGRNDTH